MSWLLPRIVATAIAMTVGTLLGLVFKGAGAMAVGGLLGVACALGVIAVRDTLHGYRLIHWLRGSQEGKAPRDAGLWGELGYRIERSIRSSEQRVALERERLEQFLSAIEAAPNGVMLLDANDQIEWCSSLAAVHFGLDPRRDRHQPVTNLVRAPAFVRHLQSGRFDEAIEMPGPGGRHRLSVVVSSYGDGQRLVLSQDITDSERSEGMRRDFVANVSHEIRSPLTVLSGFIETMKNLPLTDSERERVLVLMGRQTDRMGLLVNDLLTLAKLEGSPMPQADRWLDIAPLLEQVAIDARALSAGRHTLSFPEHVGEQIAGSQKELLSAITNLVGNAVRYTPEGGTIDVAWSRLSNAGGAISVTDTGPGIAREHLPRLTERFYRVDGSRSRDTGGTGLGLSIVKHVAQRHGGELDIRSEPGKGSTFRIVLPASRVREAPRVAKPVSMPAQSGREH